MAELKDQINQAVKEAMKAKAKDRLTTLRMATSAIKQIEIDERIELDDQRILAVIEKMIKQRKDAATQYSDGNREDLAEKELAEIVILQEFMPEALSEEELDTIIAEAIANAGASSMADMGKVMGLVKPQVQGKADMGQISGKIKAKLS